MKRWRREEDKNDEKVKEETISSIASKCYSF